MGLALEDRARAHTVIVNNPHPRPDDTEDKSAVVLDDEFDKGLQIFAHDTTTGIA